ncbi:helix-turn-helix domain-containing protein [Bacillus thuringiensis]|uniref:Transcriptional regulator n=1 Tax=Bacillus thuringiensis TaxID=1428 RepID=A0A9X7FYV1_BACTU|nr:helix-turn-helix transcriptional regulator [Bacillus thuringiensis]EKS8371179.1 helix-turn-helix transcriptional regulator [Bacillus cereus]MBG9496738.1 XRE family transcriptional regulator [Bacillus thuringiensis]MBG9504167.1 XRE family transcriptional regulator [Bacillus thuringiensis]MBG9509919.1 XRE family transcriptional regulator [Bacillus thuringiensis]MBG9510775.1 XRE family transcriptional regulator [Bacillus thuringiensis]
MSSIVKNERLKQKMTRKQLAGKLDISAAYIRKIEDGYMPRPYIMARYQTVFNRSARELFPDYFAVFNDNKFIV